MQQSSRPLDRVVAVVNRQAILAERYRRRDATVGSRSEHELEGADDAEGGAGAADQPRADPAADSTGRLGGHEPKPEEIAARIEEIRTRGASCVRADCKSDAGWKAFLAQHELTPAQVENYMRRRLEILNFIELRFRQGIRITPEEIETYYTGTLLPQYPAGEKPPPLQQVSSRIEEILLQQRVNRAVRHTGSRTCANRVRLKCSTRHWKQQTTTADPGATKE